MSHELINPEGLPPAVGFSHAVLPATGRTVYLGGQAGIRADGTVPEGIVAQFDLACENVVKALAAAGGSPEHLVSMQIFATDTDGYAAALPALGAAYRKHFGKHYPAIAYLGVSRLFEPSALVELVCIAVVPDQR